MTMVRSGKPYVVTATGQVTSQHSVLQSIICASSTSMTVTLYDTNTGTATNNVLGTMTLTAGQVYPLDMNFQSGIYAVIGGSGSATFTVS